jgi:hypothetical protein
MDLRQIRGVGALLLLLCLLGSEASKRRSAAIFFNKLVVLDLRCLHGSQDLEAFPAGRGGKGEKGDFLAMPSSFLSDGLGGEGKSRRWHCGSRNKTTTVSCCDACNYHHAFLSLA